MVCLSDKLTLKLSPEEKCDLMELSQLLHHRIDESFCRRAAIECSEPKIVDEGVEVYQLLATVDESLDGLHFEDLLAAYGGDPATFEHLTELCEGDVVHRDEWIFFLHRRRAQLEASLEGSGDRWLSDLMLKLCAGALALHSERDHADAAPVLQAGIEGMAARKSTAALKETIYLENAQTLQGLLQGRAVRLMLHEEGHVVRIEVTRTSELPN